MKASELSSTNLPRACPLNLYIARLKKFKAYYITAYFKNSGDIARGEILVPIPNTKVKSSKVDGTVVARPWESRKLPD